MAIDPFTQLEVFGPVFEQSTAIYSAQLVDEALEPITEVDSMKVTIMDLQSKYIVNDRDRVSILNENGGTFDTITGMLRFTLSAADNILLDQVKFEEDHLVRFDYTYNNDTFSGHHAILVRIRNLAKLGV